MEPPQFHCGTPLWWHLAIPNGAALDGIVNGHDTSKTLPDDYSCSVSQVLDSRQEVECKMRLSALGSCNVIVAIGCQGRTAEFAASSTLMTFLLVSPLFHRISGGPLGSSVASGGGEKMVVVASRLFFLLPLVLVAQTGTSFQPFVLLLNGEWEPNLPINLKDLVLPWDHAQLCAMF